MRLPRKWSERARKWGGDAGSGVETQNAEKPEGGGAASQLGEKLPTSEWPPGLEGGTAVLEWKLDPGWRYESL